MVYFIFIWLILCILSLWVMAYRTDADLCYDSIINFVITDNIFRTIINAIITLIVLPLTLPKNIMNLFKK